MFACRAPIQAAVGLAPAGAAPGRYQQGQRVSNSFQRQDFGEELCVQHTTDHLAAKAILDGMALEKSHREAPQPAEIVAQRSFARAAVVFAKVHVEHPVQRLNAPVTANRLAESLAAKIAAENVVSG